MEHTFTEQLFNTLGWTFIYSLWQGLLLTILAGVIVSTTKRSSPSLRYSLLTALLFCFIGAILVTFSVQWQINVDATAAQGNNAPAVAAPDMLKQFNWWTGFTQFMNQYSGWIVPAWAVIVLLKLARMLVDFYYVHRLRTSYINEPGEPWTIRMQQFTRAMGIRKQVVLLESRLVNIPIVTGHFKPVILVPLGILTRLSPAEVEAFLLHELAHIRRYDYLVNLVQRVTSILFFFNPGVLWLSALIRAERENCCDDMAIAHTKNKAQFVEALISVKQQSLSSPALAMNFLGRQNLLLHRVHRIVYNRNKSLNMPELLFVIGSILLFVCTGPTITTQTRQFPAAHPVQLATYLSNPIPPSKKQQQLTSIRSDQQQYPGVKNIVGGQAPTNRSIAGTGVNEKQPASGNKFVKETATLQYPIASSADERETRLEEERQYEKDRASAALDRIQAAKDRQAAELNRIQAAKDRAQADLDRKLADLDRIQAEKDRAQADLDRLQADKDRKQAHLDRIQADRDRAEATRVAESASMIK